MICSKAKLSGLYSFILGFILLVGSPSHIERTVEKFLRELNPPKTFLEEECDLVEFLTSETKIHRSENVVYQLESKKIEHLAMIGISLTIQIL